MLSLSYSVSLVPHTTGPSRSRLCFRMMIRILYSRGPAEDNLDCMRIYMQYRRPRPRLLIRRRRNMNVGMYMSIKWNTFETVISAAEPNTPSDQIAHSGMCSK